MAARSFTGPDGTPWQAWDVVPGQHADWPAHARQHLPAGFGEGWLCFESGAEKRRLHPIPHSWDTRSDDELRTLCDEAEPVQPRVRDPGLWPAGASEAAAGA